MNNIYQEMEVKFYVRSLAKLEERLKASGAECVQPRVEEINLRFDTVDGSLAAIHSVLRLRQDEKVRLTYKGERRDVGGANTRTEIEFEAGDFDAAKAFLEALGYRVVTVYEKYRQTYDLEGMHVTLDELPYGSFCEIEGSDPTRIYNLARRLGLNWEVRISASYLELFERLKAGRAPMAKNLVFSELVGLKIRPIDLGVEPAD